MKKNIHIPFKKQLFASAMALSMMSTPILAADPSAVEQLAQEMKAMQQRMQAMEQQINRLKTENAQLRTEQQTAVPATGSETNVADIVDTMKFSGVVEVEATAGEGYSGDDYSDFSVATVELTVEAKINSLVTAEVSALYEEDATDLEIDNAILHFAKEGNPFSTHVGQQYLPFGQFETQMVNDPLALEVAETRETAPVFQYENNGFTSSVYAFNGDVDHDSDSNDTVQNFGTRVAYNGEAFGVGVDYLSNVVDSDAISGYVEENWDDTVLGYGPDQWLSRSRSATTLYGYAQLGKAHFTGEYFRTQSFNDQELIDAAASGAPVGEQPRVWQLEAAYDFTCLSRDYTAALSAQDSDDALFLELPERRYSAVLRTGLIENVELALEYFQDRDYSESVGGTNDASHNAVMQVATEF